MPPLAQTPRRRRALPAPASGWTARGLGNSLGYHSSRHRSEFDVPNPHLVTGEEIRANDYEEFIKRAEERPIIPFKILPPKFSAVIRLPRELNGIFPTPPWGAIIVNGGTGSGKTNSINQVIERYEGYGGMKQDGSMGPRIFDTVFVFSTTANSDPAWKPFKDLEWYKFEEEYSDEKLKAIMDIQKSFDDEYKPMVCVVFDDPFAMGSFQQSRLAVTFPAFARHFNIIPIYLTQLYKGFPTVMRNNAHAFMLFSEGNYKETCKFLEEFDNHFGGIDNLEQMLRFATKEKYSFMWMLPFRREAYLRLEARLWPLNEGDQIEWMPWYEAPRSRRRAPARHFTLAEELHTRGQPFHSTAPTMSLQDLAPITFE